MTAKKKVKAPDTHDARERRDLSPEAQRRKAETCRLRIQTSKLIDRVQQHAMGSVRMTPTQLTAAQVLLRKTLPDLVGVKAEVDFSPVVFNFSIDPAPALIGDAHALIGPEDASASTT
jgi:hypothetical protein